MYAYERVHAPAAVHEQSWYELSCVARQHMLHDTPCAVQIDDLTPGPPLEFSYGGCMQGTGVYSG